MLHVRKDEVLHVHVCTYGQMITHKYDMYNSEKLNPIQVIDEIKI